MTSFEDKILHLTGIVPASAKTRKPYAKGGPGKGVSQKPFDKAAATTRKNAKKAAYAETRLRGEATDPSIVRRHIRVAAAGRTDPDIRRTPGPRVRTIAMDGSPTLEPGQAEAQGVAAAANAGAGAAAPRIDNDLNFGDMLKKGGSVKKHKRLSSHKR